MFPAITPPHYVSLLVRPALPVLAAFFAVASAHAALARGGAAIVSD